MPAELGGNLMKCSSLPKGNPFSRKVAGIYSKLWYASSIITIHLVSSPHTPLLFCSHVHSLLSFRSHHSCFSPNKVSPEWVVAVIGGWLTCVESENHTFLNPPNNWRRGSLAENKTLIEIYSVRNICSRTSLPLIFIIFGERLCHCCSQHWQWLFCCDHAKIDIKLERHETVFLLFSSSSSVRIPYRAAFIVIALVFLHEQYVTRH